MKVWYSCKVKHNQQLDDGLLKQVTSAFLLDAVSYTDAESRMYEICERDVTGEFAITRITKTNIAEIISEDGEEQWYKCKVVYSTVDGDSEKEVKINNYLLVNAAQVKDAYEKVEAHLNSMLVPYDIPSITLTSFVEVYPYSTEEENIPGNLKPLSEVEDNN